MVSFKYFLGLKRNRVSVLFFSEKQNGHPIFNHPRHVLINCNISISHCFLRQVKIR